MDLPAPLGPISSVQHRFGAVIELGVLGIQQDSPDEPTDTGATLFTGEHGIEIGGQQLGLLGRHVGGKGASIGGAA